ncbi:MAG: sulfatase-like hydrolase/transferase [Acidimicrobiia bacterium]
MSERAPRRFEPRVELRLFLELLGVYSLALTQPILSVFGKSPETFVHLGAGRWIIVVFALVVALVPATALWGIELLVALADVRARRWVHIGMVSLGVGVFVLQIFLDAMGLPLVPSYVLAGAATGGSGLAYTRFTSVRSWTAYLSPAALAFTFFFLLASPVSTLVLPSDVALADVELSGAETPVVLIVLDEFPTLTLMDADGMIDRDLFPSLAALADDSTWYRNATTVHTLTTHAVPAVETGQMPPEAQVAPDASVYPESIFTLLGSSYEVNSIQAFAVCPSSVCPPVTDGAIGILGDLVRSACDVFTERLTTDGEADGLAATLEDRPHDEMTAERVEGFEAFVDTIGPGRTLSAGHTLLPHHPWLLLPSGDLSNSTYEEEHPVTTGGWGDPEVAAIGRQHHYLQMMYVDTLVGEVTSRLEELGVYDDALIVVTADHGIAFKPGEPRRLSTELSVPEVAWVPLIVKLPGQTEPVVTDENALTIDIVPTIADVLGIDIPWSVDGIPLTSETRTGTDKAFVPYQENPEDFYPFGEDLDGDAGLSELLQRARGRFVETMDPRARPFARGAHGEMVGRPVADFTVGPPASTTGTWNSPPSDDDLDAVEGRPVRPVWISGLIPDEFGPDPQLAYVVDGVVVATSATFEPADGRREFGTLLPESTVGAGPVEVYAIEDGRDSLVLRPLTFDG